MVISANRLSSVNGRVSIGINENYGSEDLGRIMLEDAKNDMAIFNAALMQDMHEIKARQEGTLLESEIQAISENAIKDFCKKIVEKLKAFWAKMKAWFKTAIANISAYIVRDGQAFVKMHLKDIGALKPDDECGDRWCVKKKLEVKIPDTSGFEKLGADSTATEIRDAFLKMACSSYSEGDNFYDCLKNELFEEVKGATVKDMGGTNRMVESLRSGKNHISQIKKEQAEGEREIKKMMREAEKAGNSALQDEEKKGDNKDSDKIDSLNKKINLISNASSGITAMISTIGKSSIKLIKFNMAQCRKALATAIGRSARASAKTEATLLESLLLEADEEIEQLSDNEYASDLTPAEEKAVEDLVDAIEEKIEDAESGDDD